MNINYLRNFYVSRVTYLTTPRSAPASKAYGQRSFDGKTLHGKGKGTLNAKALRWQRPLDKGTLRSKALRWQSPCDDKGKGSLKAKAIRWQNLSDIKGKGRAALRRQTYELYDCNKQTSSFLTITRALVRLGRSVLHYQRVQDSSPTEVILFVI
jgi:hypothetical protein